MAKILYILSGLMLLIAGSALMLCIHQFFQDDIISSMVLTSRGAVETFIQNRDRYPQEAGERTSPLVAQAQAFASYINPIQPEKDTASDLPRFASRNFSSTTPAIRPAAPTMIFKLHGTSCCPNQPEKSMALIWEPVGIEGTARWVKEGTRLGHFVVHEIRRGVVVLQDGKQLRELSIERGQAPKSLVRDTKADQQHVNATINDDRLMLPPAPGPNSIEAGVIDITSTD
jgi:hypothetical protein